MPWRFLVRRLARSQGFLDPVVVLARLQRFSQPSEVMAPTELLRAGAVLQARGLINSQAIQHNLDWVWPYWVERQFDPRDVSFVPRAFNVTHINLTHRNWTAVGVPDAEPMPIVDPRGLVTPTFDGWSLDAWVLPEEGEPVLPSRALEAAQEVCLNGRFAVSTSVTAPAGRLDSRADVSHEAGLLACRLHLTARSASGGWLAVSLRPYNPEGVSFVNEVERLADRPGWRVNSKDHVYFTAEPERQRFSSYAAGDVYSRLPGGEEKGARCDVGLATAAALFRLEPGVERTVGAIVPIGQKVSLHFPGGFEPVPAVGWHESLEGQAKLEMPDERFGFLYEVAVRTLVLHSPADVYPGPYTYKRFWFRDAAFILHAMLCIGLHRRSERTLDRFVQRQTPFGYFLSQEGEWDSNGEALWTWARYCELTGRPPKPEWKSAIYRGARWIVRKRLKEDATLHSGLLPAGFSAEHLGPNDYYYWDDYWGVAGLRAASALAALYGDASEETEFRDAAADFERALERSVGRLPSVAAQHVVPASPYRRPDAGAVGSIVAGYPLGVWKESDPRGKATAAFLLDHYFLDGGFFQEISHSGVNPYLSLHVAQLLLRAGDERFFGIVESIAAAASPTGQWPEAIHPRTKGGCMGDGQHVWASAEWVMMMRNLFVREEDGVLVLGSGLVASLRQKGRLSFADAWTRYGKVSVRCERAPSGWRVSWEGRWHASPPAIEIRLPGFEPRRARDGETSIEFAGGRP